MKFFFPRRFFGNSLELPPPLNAEHNSGVYKSNIVSSIQVEYSSIRGFEVDHIAFWNMNFWEIELGEIIFEDPNDYYFHVIKVFQLLDLKHFWTHRLWVIFSL